MARPRSLVSDYLVYAAVRLAVAILQVLPYRVSCSLADGLAWLAYQVNRRHRLVALDNLRHAYPGQYTAAQLDGMVRNVYRHFCRLVVDMTRLPRAMRIETHLRHVELDTKLWCNLLMEGRPLLMVTGHFGNWELGGFMLGALGFRTYAIARPLDNRFLHKWFLEDFRQKSGQTILAKNDDFERIQGALAAGGALATLGDQDAGPKGLFVDFFGRPASTHKAVALLAIQYQAPMIVLGVRRAPALTRHHRDTLARHQLVVADVIRPEEYEGRPGAIREITERYTQALERLIDSAPEQYFWLHRRWKHEPPKRKGKAKAA